MRTELISIGDELLIGQTINTNASWIGNKLSQISISVDRVLTVSDDKAEIISALDSSIVLSDLVIMTGGLGPTKDDVTKMVLAEYFGMKLIENKDVLNHVKKIFEKKNRPMLDVNVRQAYVPEFCEVIFNSFGTAPGMWFQKNGKVVVSLPGVPYEMKGIFEEVLLEKIKSHFNTESIYYKTMLTTGLGESYLADKIQDWENMVRSNGFQLAYLPTPGLVKLKITSKNGGKDKELIETYFRELETMLPDNFFGYDNDLLESVVGELLKSKKQTVGTVESCTGGKISSSIVSISGSSEYYKGSIISYSNEIKSKIVGVSQATLDQFGAVSEQVVVEMAEKGKLLLNSDYTIAVSGIAGPEGGSVDKPVGLVWIAVAGPAKTIVNKFYFGNNRENNIEMTKFASLNTLRMMLK